MKEWNEWKTYSRVLDCIDPFLPFFVEGLSDLSDNLIEKFKDIHSQEDDKDKLMVFGSPEFLEYWTLSQLWVTGSYEVIRTIDQKASEKNLFDGEIRKDIKDVKHYFERIRVPMTKMESARRGYKDDYNYPLLHFKMGEGAIWMINKTTYLSRKVLSETFLKLLKILYEFNKKNSLQK